MANTTNYNWETPDDTDLVKDGAAAIRTLGSSIDTTTKNLNPQTTTGAIAYRSATANVNTALAIGSSGQVLTVAAGVPSWATPTVGDITEVQAGTGISVASGTGPIPVVTNTVATAFDAAGDLVYGTGADTFTKLSIGTANQVLRVNSGATAPEWATPASGKVVQIVYGSTSTQATTSSNSFSDSGLTATITPTSASNKILVFATQNGITKTGVTGVKIRLLRAGTEIALMVSSAGYDDGSGENQIGNISLVYEDSPATTSSTIYKTQFASAAGIATAYVQVSSAVSGILLMEVTP